MSDAQSGTHARARDRGSVANVYHDPAVARLLQLETFERAFDVKDFIAGLSEKVLSRSKTESGPLSPRPLIRTFEHAVVDLLEIRAQVQAKAERLDGEVHVAEQAYTKKLKELSVNVEAVSSSFSSLENRISEVGRTAIRIGEQLQTIDRQRLRASEAHDLIQYYYQFAQGDTSRVDTLLKSRRPEDRHTAAVVARRLAAISREVDVEGAEKTREEIDRYCESFEKMMLKLFDRSFRKGDPKMMAHCAKVLQDFNGGASCVQIYVNQHDFFISKNRVEQAEAVLSSTIWDALPDPDALPPKSEPALDALFAEIRETVNQEAHIIQAVFPEPIVVMQNFLQRVFAQSIQGFVEVLMQKAGQYSDLTSLRALHMARSSTFALADDLKPYDFSGRIASGSTLSPNGVISPGNETSITVAGSGGSGSALAPMLDQAVEELFVPYMESGGVKYLEREAKSLTELFATYLARFERWHQDARKAKSTTLLDRMRTQLTSSSNTTPSTPSASGLFNKLSGLGVARSTTPTPGSRNSGGESADLEVQVEEKDGELNLDVAERMLRWHAEAVGRCVDLSASSDVPKNSFVLLKVLSEAFIKSYVETALDTAKDRISSTDSRTEPDLRPLRVVKMVDMVINLWQHYVKTALLPLASSSVTVRREMAIFDNHNMLRVEGKVNAMVQRGTDVVLSWLTSRLALQKKTDYKPKNDDLSFAQINTEPCLACCEMLSKVRDVARESLSGKNLEVFLTEIGVGFHSLLLDHLKKFPVSATGGLMLTKDLAMYQDEITTFDIPALNDRFEMIRQLGNLFIVQPGVLKSYMNESYLGKIDEALLRPYLAQRVDYPKFARRFSALAAEVDGGGGGPAPSAGLPRIPKDEGVTRLGQLVRDLEALVETGRSSEDAKFA